MTMPLATLRTMIEAVKADTRAHTIAELEAAAGEADIKVDFDQRKAEIVDDLEVAVDAIEGSQEEDEDSQEEDEDSQEEDEGEVADLKAQVAELKAQVAKLKAQAAQRGQPLGSIASPSGVLALADVDRVEQQWKASSSAASSYAVHFLGKHAAYLAKRMGTGTPPKDLGDGTWRLVVPTVAHARRQKGEADSWLARQPDGAQSSVEIVALGATKCQAADAARSGAGPFSLGFAVKTQHASITGERRADGTLASITLHL